MENKIALEGTGEITIGGYLNSLDIGGQEVGEASAASLGLTNGESTRIIGKLTVTIEEIPQETRISGTLGKEKE